MFDHQGQGRNTFRTTIMADKASSSSLSLPSTACNLQSSEQSRSKSRSKSRSRSRSRSRRRRIKSRTWGGGGRAEDFCFQVDILTLQIRFEILATIQCMVWTNFIMALWLHMGRFHQDRSFGCFVSLKKTLCWTALVQPDLLRHFFLLFFEEHDYLITLPQPQPPISSL